MKAGKGQFTTILKSHRVQKICSTGDRTTLRPLDDFIFKYIQHDHRASQSTAKR